MGVLEVLGLLLLAAVAWFLWDGLKAREVANRAIGAACRQGGLLFLNDTVELDSVRPVRSEAGRVILRRVYRFEYSDTGHNRRTGRVTLVGDRVAAVDVGPPSVEQGPAWP